MTAVRDVLTKVQTRLSMVAGPGVQRYAEDNILAYIETAYDRLIDKEWWPVLMEWAEVELDGVDGLPTTDLTVAARPLVKFEDIRQIKLDRDCDALPQVPSNVIPSTVLGSNPLFYQYSSSRMFKVVPATSTGTVFVNYRTRPTSFTLDTDLVLDTLLVTLAAAWEYMVDDGTNPMAINKLEEMAGKREREVMKNISHEPIPFNSYPTGYNSAIYDWQEV